MSFVEVLVVVVLIGILSSTALSNLTVLDRPLEDGTVETMGFFKQVRARAMATTLAYTISPDGEGKLSVTRATDCDEDQEWDPLSLTLPRQVGLTATNWSLCFTPRGLSTSNQLVELRDNEGRTKQIEVFLGGAMRVAP